MNLLAIKLRLKTVKNSGRTGFYHGCTSRPPLFGALSPHHSWVLGSTVDGLAANTRCEDSLIPRNNLPYTPVCLRRTQGDDEVAYPYSSD